MNLKRLTNLALALFFFVVPNTQAISIDTEGYFLNNLTPVTLPSFKYTITVSSSSELINAIKLANQKNNTLIKLKPGRYQIKSTLQISGNNISIIGDPKAPFAIRISGNGMRATRDVDNLLWISGKSFFLAGVTLEHAGNHLIQIVGESNADNPTITHSVLQNGYEQLLKVSYSLGRPQSQSKSGVVSHCLFRYTKGIGPNYYIGGIDAHGITNWQITDNVFDSIASSKDHIAEHAIHIWNNSAQNTVSNNLIVNSDRGIGFGMRNGHHKNRKYGHLGGIISGNIIYHANNKHPFADTGIILEDSPETNITKNIILLEHNYKNAIEYRFEQTTDVLIANNTTNKQIRSRNGGSAITLSNTINQSKTEKAIKTRLAGFIDY